MANEVKLSWDGDKILQRVKVEDVKMTPKDLLDGLDQVRNNINQMEDQLQKLEDNKVRVERELRNAKDFEKDRREFEDRAIEIQLEKLNFYVDKIKDEIAEKALAESEAEIAKDPHAYTQDQKDNLKYVKFQRGIATHPKIAQKISTRMLKKYIFEEPIFENPFSDR